ncbi:MAG: aspartate/glutamate racemase family protein, partial [Acidobacteria bacterium]|nr:aspartate/glutamate racemase family protein [Acidobacteriota bacterium]
RTIYQIKAGATPEEAIAELGSLLDHYPVRGLVAGCTELHLLTRRLPASSGLSIIDPLDLIARHHIGASCP